VTTHENLHLPHDIAGHIGVKSYYTRKGIVILSGLQIDPGFEGVLVIGMYNASPSGSLQDIEGQRDEPPVKEGITGGSEV
jgi:deoxycytidine triphosphate deaminase